MSTGRPFLAVPELLTVIFYEEGNSLMTLFKGGTSDVEKPCRSIKTPCVSLTKTVWGIGVRHIVLMALGATLYATLSYMTNPLQLPGSDAIVLRPGIVIPLFLGAISGPWVGLFTGLVGNAINDLLTGSIYWNWEIGIGLIGFIAGLVLYITRGGYQAFSHFVYAEIFSALGLLLGLFLAATADIWVWQMSFAATSTTEFLPVLVPDLVFGLILLPVLLIAYNATARRVGHY